MNDPSVCASVTPPAPGADAPLFVVLNVASGRHDAGDTQQTLAGLFDAAGRRHRFLLIKHAGDLQGRAKEAVRLACEQGGIVVAAGGDGTINAVALYTQLLEDREVAKAQLGRSRLVAMGAGLLTLVRERRQLRLTLEMGGATRDIRTPSLFVGNNRLQLERLGLPEAEALEQGQLAAIVVRPIGALAMLGLALRGALGRLGEAENVVSFPTHRLTVHPHRRHLIKVATDGEVTHMRAPLVFRVAPQPLLLMAPREDDRVEMK